eukprot:4684832-Amphidinium_carterae.2
MTIIPPQMYELRSPAMPPLRQQPGTLQQEWHYRPPDQPPLEQTQRVPTFTTFPTFPKRPNTVQPFVQPPPGLQQPELITAPQQPILPLQQQPEMTTQAEQPQTQGQQPPPQPSPQPQVR